MRNEIQQPGEGQAFSRTAARMNFWERRELFRELVLVQLRQGPLSKKRRRALVQYAAVLGVNAVDAGRLVQQALKIQHALKTHQKRQERSSPDLHIVPTQLTAQQTEPTLSWKAVLAVIIGATMINSWLILRLVG